MDFFVRFVQVHETFRKPEIDSLAIIAGINVAFLQYSEQWPFAIVRLSNEAAARTLISRSISSKGIYELWGSGSTYDELHIDVKRRTSTLWPQYQVCTFKFDWDTYQGSRAFDEQRAIIESFDYMGFEGKIQMKNAEQTFCIFEEYDYHEKASATLRRVYLGRFIAPSSRHILDTYTLKKRQYINTTSMDSELAFLTANITLAGPDKIFYDPFVGTGSFPVACSHFGARTWGSDIDGRMIRGRGGKDLRTNFRQYGLLDFYGDGFAADLTHCPLRGSSKDSVGGGRWLDGIICDPPYGVREGLKVLGTKDGSGKEVVFVDGQASHLQEKYVPPKRAYSLEAMLGDILTFAARMLVDDGRVSLWMPTANEAEDLLAIPSHPSLELVSICIQVFNKWSRRLLTYRRIPGADAEVISEGQGRKGAEGTTADELNDFRKRYFQGFRTQEASSVNGKLQSEEGKGEGSGTPSSALESVTVHQAGEVE